ncbi:hypothetical protein MSG28_002194 [Choristoneura fumiferana]|uniref:Uncharacterized protein n=1 Tax=Choristoneura fumiferana TaxID=7141 RepID=A0ACC0JUA4_CHOFU|nr:hypothetical protein MSG28_002194 [Choristoneura fumiferana]
MGKNPSSDASIRNTIVTLVLERKWTYRKVAEHLKCSKTKVFNAIRYFKKNRTCQKDQRKQRARKTTPRTDALIVRMAKKKPKLSSVEIKRQLFGEQSGLAARTIRKRLNEANLFGRVARKKPLVNKKRVKFAKKHKDWTLAQWKHVLWSDETKINRIVSDGQIYVRRPPNTAFNSNSDLNPIENLWNDVKKILANKNIRNLNELYEATQEARRSIPVEICRSLVESMTKRCLAVLQNKGFPSKY